jgi:hypothetical protein
MQTPTTSTPPISTDCPHGTVAAHIGGRLKCLHTGTTCASHYQHQYRAHGFVCVRSGRRARLKRLRR